MAGTPQLSRIDQDIHADAAAAAPLMDRSVTKQLSHWARIGREVEATAIQDTRRRRLAAVLHGDGSLYDTLPADEQAHVRAIWGQQIDEAAATVNVAAIKAAAGLPYATVDSDGTPVIVNADGTRTPA